MYPTLLKDLLHVAAKQNSWNFLIFGDAESLPTWLLNLTLMISYFYQVDKKKQMILTLHSLANMWGKKNLFQHTVIQEEKKSQHLSQNKKLHENTIKNKIIRFY